MNREILFRGKWVDNGEWVYGDLIHAGDKFTNSHHILHWEDGTTCPVIPETVGQFTGLTDKNGTKIFEGDVMKWECGSDSLNVIVVFQDGKFGGRIESYNHISHHIDLSYLEITGNIHDNPTT